MDWLGLVGARKQCKCSGGNSKFKNAYCMFMIDFMAYGQQQIVSCPFKYVAKSDLKPIIKTEAIIQPTHFVDCSGGLLHWIIYMQVVWCQWQTVDYSNLQKWNDWVPANVSVLEYCNNIPIRCSLSIYTMISEGCVISCKKDKIAFSFKWRYVQPLKMLAWFFCDCIGKSCVAEHNTTAWSSIPEQRDYSASACSAGHGGKI